MPGRRRNRTQGPPKLEQRRWKLERLRRILEQPSWLEISKQSLLWPILAVLFPDVYKTIFKDKDSLRSGLRLLRLAERSAYVLFFFCLVEIDVLGEFSIETIFAVD